MRPALALLALSALLPVGVARAQDDSQVVDRVVAVVRIRVGAERTGDRKNAQDTLPPDVITQSGLELEARVAMINRGALGAATEPLDEATLQSALDNAVWERLLAGEADVLQAFRVEPSEVDLALRAFRARFRDPADFEAFLRRNEVDVQALGRILERSLRASRVLDSKVRLRAQVSEAEVRRYYDAHKDELAQPFDDVRAALREKLFRERYQALVKSELRQLERAHDVRRVAPFAQERGRAQG